MTNDDPDHLSIIYRAARKWLDRDCTPQPIGKVTLTAEDSQVFAEALINPPEPNQTLKDAAIDYHDLRAAGYDVTICVGGKWHDYWPESSGHSVVWISNCRIHTLGDRLRCQHCRRWK